MPRRRVVLPLVAVAAAAAVALPMAGLLGAPGDVLPDLRADPPANPYYQVYSDGRLLLRFDGYVTNVGAGPLDVNGNPNGSMYQRVLNGGTLANDHTVPVQYQTADGHDHFHLMRIMRYSLRTAAGTEVAPGQKVGFCLYDYAQATNFSGTRAPQVYALGRPGDDFCRRGNPGATSLNMGVGAGWRDDYGGYLALQWVDVSDTTPGIYRLAAEADPNGIVRESNDSNPVAVSSATVAVPGYVPKAIGPVSAPGDGQTQIPVTSDAFGAPGPVAYAIVSQPARGSVTLAGSTAVYTAGPGAPGTYSFAYSAAQSGSAYPRTKRTATVTLNVGSALAAAVTISGAPASMIAGTSAQLAATVVNAPAGVTWSASAGTISPAGLFVAPSAPPPGGTVTVRAASTASPGAVAQATIGIAAAPAPVPAPGGPGTGPVSAVGGSTLPRSVIGELTIPKLTRNGRSIVVRTVPRAAGKITITAIRGGTRLARCSVTAKPGARVTCLLRVPARVAKLPVRVVVGLRTADGTRAVARALSRG